MAKAVLDLNVHKYRVEGDDRVDPEILLPSVSNIARYADSSPADGLIKWGIKAYMETGNIDAFIDKRNQAGEYGSMVHSLIDRYVSHKSGITEDQKEAYRANPLFKAWMELMVKKNVSFFDSELTVWNPDLLYAGTLDAMGEVDGRITVFDWKTKTSTSSPAKEHAVQIAGYCLALEAMNKPSLIMPRPTRAVVVYLYRDTGKARWCEVDLGKAKFAFMHCLNLFNMKGYYVK
jgi:hypothetical protein